MFAPFQISVECLFSLVGVCQKDETVTRTGHRRQQNEKKNVKELNETESEKKWRPLKSEMVGESDEGGDGE